MFGGTTYQNKKETDFRYIKTALQLPWDLDFPPQVSLYYNERCVLMYNLHQEMADRSNAQQAINTQYGGNNVTTVQNPGAGAGQMIVTNAASGSSIPSFGSSFTGNTDYYIQGGQPVSLESSL